MDRLSHEASFVRWQEHKNLARVDTDLVVHEFLRSTHLGFHVTRTSPSKCDLLGYASAGHAVTSRVTESGYDASRVYKAPASRLGGEPGTVDDLVNFGRLTYHWQSDDFIVYQVSYTNSYFQKVELLYVLAPSTPQHILDGYHVKTDALLLAAGQWTRELHGEIWVYDDSQWAKSKMLWRSVQDASWNDVILDPTMKANIIQDVQGFFDNQKLYQDFKVPWKRGMILHGVPGNGKTVTIKALINSLASRPHPVQSLYVKSLDACSGPKWSLQQIFRHARRMAPCLLIFEDLDSLVTDNTRSYFLNEVDGLESNDGILMIGSTNHLDRLDPAVTKRPSRFDRKYHYKIPSEEERLAYCQYWRKKFSASTTVDFPEEICAIVAKLTQTYSFAYLKELFVTSLLLLARGIQEENGEGSASEVSSNSEVFVDSDSAMAPDKEDSLTAGDKNESPAPGRDLPVVDIPEALLSNELLHIIRAQAKVLLEEMDHAAATSPVKGACKTARPARRAYRPVSDDDY